MTKDVINIRRPSVARQIRELARLRNRTLTDTVGEVVSAELARLERTGSPAPNLREAAPRVADEPQDGPTFSVNPAVFSSPQALCLGPRT